jgi:hypothetical protein
MFYAKLNFFIECLVNYSNLNFFYFKNTAIVKQFRKIYFYDTHLPLMLSYDTIKGCYVNEILKRVKEDSISIYDLGFGIIRFPA